MAFIYWVTIWWIYGQYFSQQENTFHNNSSVTLHELSVWSLGCEATIWWRVVRAILSYNNYNERITSISLRIVRGRAQSRVAWHCDAASWQSRGSHLYTRWLSRNTSQGLMPSWWRPDWDKCTIETTARWSQKISQTLRRVDINPCSAAFVL